VSGSEKLDFLGFTGTYTNLPYLIAVGVAGRLNLDQIVAKLGGNGRDIALLEKMSWSEHRPIPCIKLCLKGPQNAFGYKRQSVI
jgi:hypothetical protein